MAPPTAKPVGIPAALSESRSFGSRFPAICLAFPSIFVILRCFTHGAINTLPTPIQPNRRTTEEQLPTTQRRYSVLPTTGKRHERYCPTQDILTWLSTGNQYTVGRKSRPRWIESPSQVIHPNGPVLYTGRSIWILSHIASGIRYKPKLLFDSIVSPPWLVKVC